MGLGPELILANGRVLDGRGGIAERATILVAGGLIAGVYLGGDAPDGSAVVDVAGQTVLPALVDAHVHLSAYDMLPAQKRGEEPRTPALRYFELANGARALVEAGVLTVRDVGSMDDNAVELRQAVRLGLCPGPRILTCARIVSATSPGWRIFTTMYRAADGTDEVRKAVREQIMLGADFVKVMATGARSVVLEDPEPPQLSPAELEVVVEEAHRLGKRVAAHAEGLAGTRAAIESGVDTVEHGLSLHREPALLERMAAAGQVLVPTLSTFHDVSEDHAEKYPCTLVELAKRQREEAYLTLAAAVREGVTLAMGFDSYPHGRNALELVRMVEGGLTGMAGLVAATSGSAEACGLAGEVGVVAAGAAADLLVVDGDPVAEPRLLLDPQRIRLVLQAGERVAGTMAAPPRRP
jgi:imidazolonepropionase-like amidohydrolase